MKNLSSIDLNVFIFVHICMKNIDSFTYIIIDRYIFAVFYDIMVDLSASIQSIVDYEQYLTFIKNIFIDLNHIKTDIVNVQFEIESISSVESLIIDILFELIEFHVIKTNTSFLLSLADMNRVRIMVLGQSKRRTLFRRRKFDVLIESI